MHNDPPIPRLLTPDEAAKLLGVSPKTLANWRSQGVGPWYKRRGGIAYLESDLTEWLLKSRQRTRA